MKKENKGWKTDKFPFRISTENTSPRNKTIQHYLQYSKQEVHMTLSLSRKQQHIWKTEFGIKISYNCLSLSSPKDLIFHLSVQYPSHTNSFFGLDS